MALPMWIEQYTEPESDPAGPGVVDRILSAPLVKPALGLVALLVLWADAARQGLWGLPDPFLGSFARYAAAALAGLGIGILVRQRARPATPADVSPRLPVFLRFDHRPVVVVGGGGVAAAKIPALLAAGGDVTVIAPVISSAIDRSRVRVRQREFEPADLDGAWFVTAAATPEVNRLVRDAAEVRGVFVNAVDDPPNATAYLGGTIARGGVTVAFSTSGEAPALAGLLREAFDELVPADIGTWVTHAADLRRRQRAEGVPMADRRPQLLEALNRLYDSRDRASQPGR